MNTENLRFPSRSDKIGLTAAAPWWTLAAWLSVVQQSCMMKAVIVAIGAAATLCAAVETFAGTTYQNVAGHQFDVPKDHLFEARIPWLPAPASDSFTFLFEANPNPEQIPKHRVLVQSLDRRCNNQSSELMRVACGTERELVVASPEYERRNNGIGSWSSDLYIIKRDARTKNTLSQQIAYCQLFDANPVQPKPNNLCTTVWAYKGMLLQFSFDESEVNRLQDMKAQAMTMLDRWMVR